MNQRRLGNYELQERLGRDAIGETWLALDTQHRRSVAIKLVEVTPETSADFLQQGQKLAALEHPNIVHIQECAVSPNQYEAYIVMDFIEGQTLNDYLDATARTGSIPPPAEIIRLLTPIAAALDYAHQQQVVHGGLKPSVILFDLHRGTAPGEPMLVNFGLRRRDPRLLSPEAAHYVAPEVAQGGASTARSDLYALGVILYELCTGTLPFQGDATNDILMQHIHGSPTSPALINPYIRPALTSVILRGLARDPAARYSSATTFVAAVAKAMSVRGSGGLSQPMPALGSSNPPSFSGISGSLDGANAPTYLSHQPPPIPQAPLSWQTPSQPMQVLSNTPQSTSMTPARSVPGLAPQPEPPAGGLTTVQSQPSQFQAASYPTIPADKPTAVSPAPLKKRGLRPWMAALLVVLALLLVGSGVLVYFTLSHIAATNQQTALVGHAFFISSGLISETNNQGITDELHVALQNIPDAQAGKRYYGWLLSTSQIDVPPLALGALPLDHGSITLTYSSPQHSNLLTNYSRFLITEEDAGQAPVNPSLDKNTWSYYAAFSTTPNQADAKKYSELDHLRHLLSQDPKLHAAGIPGGLDVWLYRNVSKIVEAAGSARDTQKLCVQNQDTACTDFVLRQVARILDYLDGSTYVQTEGIPTRIQGQQLLIDPTIARVALLEFDALKQEPPGYLDHIGSHLRNLSQIPDITPNQHALAIRINQDINNVQGWLDTVHADASKLIHMSGTQLLQPGTATMLNDLFTQANMAFVGQVDPNTNNVKEGVVQIHYNIQALATFDIAPCTINNGQSSCA